MSTYTSIHTRDSNSSHRWNESRKNLHLWNGGDIYAGEHNNCCQLGIPKHFFQMASLHNDIAALQRENKTEKVKKTRRMLFPLASPLMMRVRLEEVTPWQLGWGRLSHLTPWPLVKIGPLSLRSSPCLYWEFQEGFWRSVFPAGLEQVYSNTERDAHSWFSNVCFCPIEMRECSGLLSDWLCW